jgi:hypothetical protein
MWLDITVVHGSNLRWIIVITMRSGIMAAAGTKKFDFILRGGHVVACPVGMAACRCFGSHRGQGLAQ